MANNNDKFISRENAKTLWGYMVYLLTGKYTKPSGGIPKSDLDSSVQTSLGKADTALQTFTETDPTVPSWAKQSSKPSYNQDEVGDGTTYKRVSSTEKDTWNAKGTYSKPSSGIPKTDLASEVQTSLEKADSALQSETDPTVPSWAKQSSKPSYNSDEISDTNRTHKFATQAQLNQININQTNILYTMNRTGKNILPIDLETLKARNTYGRWNGNSYTELGVTFTVNDDCTISVSGTNTSSTDNAVLKLATYLDYLPKIQTGRYTLSGCPSGGSIQSYYINAHRAKTTNPIATYEDTGEGVTGEFDYSLASTNQSTILICIRPSYAITGTLVFSPMLRNASIEDGTYEHYALSNSDLTELEAEDRNALVSIADNGAKNYLQFDSLKYSTSITGKSVLVNGVRFTLNDDFSITVNRESASSELAYVSLMLDSDYSNVKSLCDNAHYLVGCPQGGSQNTFRLYVAGGSYFKGDTGSGVLLTSSSETGLYVNIAVYSGYNIQNLTFKPMIIDKSVYDTGFLNYQPYAKSNADLTQLEATDRAELVELVDSGAKNKFDLPSLDALKVSNSSGTWSNNVYTLNNVTFTVDTTNKTISTSGTASAVTQFIVESINPESTKYSGLILSGCPSGGDYDNGYSLFTANNSLQTIEKDTGDGVLVGSTAIRYINIMCRNGTNMSGKVFKPMICTKAAFDVSPAFVPYRPDYDTLIDTVDKKAPALSNSAITSGSLNDFPESFVCVSSNVTDLPPDLLNSTWGFVRTSIFDNNTALQELFAYSSADQSQNGVSFVRVKQGGTWKSWKQITNA